MNLVNLGLPTYQCRVAEAEDKTKYLDKIDRNMEICTTILNDGLGAVTDTGLKECRIRYYKGYASLKMKDNFFSKIFYRIRYLFDGESFKKYQAKLVELREEVKQFRDEYTSASETNQKCHETIDILAKEKMRISRIEPKELRVVVMTREQALNVVKKGDDIGTTLKRAKGIGEQMFNQIQEHKEILSNVDTKSSNHLKNEESFLVSKNDLKKLEKVGFKFVSL